MAGNREFFRVAASGHYEVEHTNPNHAGVESCPICGRTGAYQDLTGDRNTLRIGVVVLTAAAK